MRIGFYHPYPGGGGGGERVLWKIIDALSDLSAEGSIDLEAIDIYIAEGRSKSELLLFCCFSLSLSLSHTHTHAHTRAQKRRHNEVRGGKVPDKRGQS